jgi:hypothetical protein
VAGASKLLIVADQNKPTACSYLACSSPAAEVVLLITSYGVCKNWGLDEHEVAVEGMPVHGASSATMPNEAMKIKEEGMPVHGVPSQHGDLFAELKIQMPKTLTADQKAALEKTLWPLGVVVSSGRVVVLRGTVSAACPVCPPPQGSPLPRQGTGRMVKVPVRKSSSTAKPWDPP